MKGVSRLSISRAPLTESARTESTSQDDDSISISQNIILL
jgi:hypothetical protein